jgi:hypothetical protein
MKSIYFFEYLVPNSFQTCCIPVYALPSNESLLADKCRTLCFRIRLAATSTMFLVEHFQSLGHGRELALLLLPLLPMSLLAVSVAV